MGHVGKTETPGVYRQVVAACIHDPHQIQAPRCSVGQDKGNLLAGSKGEGLLQQNGAEPAGPAHGNRMEAVGNPFITGNGSEPGACRIGCIINTDIHLEGVGGCVQKPDLPVILGGNGLAAGTEGEASAEAGVVAGVHRTAFAREGQGDHRVPAGCRCTAVIARIGRRAFLKVRKDMREWLSWWSTTLPRSGPRVRVPSRALFSFILSCYSTVGSAQHW